MLLSADGEGGDGSLGHEVLVEKEYGVSSEDFDFSRTREAGLEGLVIILSGLWLRVVIKGCD